MFQVPLDQKEWFMVEAFDIAVKHFILADAGYGTRRNFSITINRTEIFMIMEGNTNGLIHRLSRV
jgi:hypothetical protein